MEKNWLILHRETVHKPFDKENGIHKYVDHTGPIILDSGGYQLINHNKSFKLEETIEIYRKANFQQDDFGIVLDYCPLIFETPKDRLDKITRSNENFITMKKLAPELSKKIVPVLHGWTMKEIRKSLDPVGEENLISFGSCLSLKLKGYQDKIIQKFVNLYRLIKEYPDLKDIRIHILGASGANSSHVCWYSGFEQTDSASWRRIASYGKIVFVGVSEAYISNRNATFGRTTWNEKFDILLKECECPICKDKTLVNKKSILAESFPARATHNAYIYLQERELAKELIGTPQYHRYLTERFKRSYFMKKFLMKMKEAKFQPQIDTFLRN
jgi:tRNA-guanine family transglycosylase